MTPGTPGARAAALFPPSVAVAEAAPCDPATLHPAERAAMTRAVPARQREFAGGRAAARIALNELGFTAQTVPMGADRAPVWPGGVRGTITHAAGICLAAVTTHSRILGIGLDLEADLPLPAEAAAQILGPDEDPSAARTIFAAKEAVFKALYPSVRHIFGFDAVRIALLDQVFTATTLQPLGPIPTGTVLQGRLDRGNGLILAGLTI